VKVTTQLIDATTGTHLWSEAYERDFKDIFEIQADIAMNVANALNAAFSPEEQRNIEELPTDSIEAYDHYLLARSLGSQGFGAEALLGAIAEYDQALALDPAFKLAKLGRAQAAAPAVLLGIPGAPSAAALVEAIDEATALADELPAALWFVAQRRILAYEWSEAERAYREWLARAPANDYEANLAYGTFLKDIGRARDSLPYLELARRKDPLLAGPSIQLTLAFDALGDFDRAVELHNRMEALVGYDFTAAGPHLWRLLARDGDWRAALDAVAADGQSGEELVVLWASAPDVPNGGRVFKVFASNLDDPNAGRSALHAVYDDPTSDNFSVMLNVALLAAYYGDDDLSVAAFSRTARPVPQAMLQFAWTPLMRSVRGHPGFKSTLKDLGLDAYWREAGWPEHCRPVGADDFTCS
jgi:tetratricopeptide (TPR) repeat protein